MSKVADVLIDIEELILRGGLSEFLNLVSQMCVDISDSYEEERNRHLADQWEKNAVVVKNASRKVAP